METFKLPANNKKTVLALGSESAGNFSLHKNEKVYFSEDFGDLLQNANFNQFKDKLNKFLKQNKIKPYIIITDLHPLYKTTILGQKLSKKFKAKHIQIQHHIAHIFSAIGDKIIEDNLKFSNTYGIALDGTGYGLDGKIWGGEIFKFKIQNSKFKIQRIGHLENQILIGGDLAIQEPARMLISILKKFSAKEKIYEHIKKYYSKNEFEVLYNQLQQNFNCIETSGTGRILDAVSILLGFCGNKRNYKHEPIDLLEKNSTKPCADLKPKIIYDKKEKLYILQTTCLFEYLIKNLHEDKCRLAATAQLYIAKGLYKIIKSQCSGETATSQNIFLAGGIANNKIISSYFESKGAYTRPVKFANGDAKLFNRENKKVYPVKSERSEFNGVPRGDAGLSFGQIFYYLLADSRN